MRFVSPTLLVVVFVGVLPAVAAASDSSRQPAARESSRTAVAPIPASPDTSMLTGNGLNTTAWPIDKVTPGGVMRKLPGTREWTFIPGMSDAQMQQLRKSREAEMVRLHGNEPRNVEIAVPDSTALRKLWSLGIADSCAPPCTLATRVLYRQLPQLANDSIRFWGKGDRRPLPPGVQQRSRPAR